jgi:hypothetical protein
MLYNRFFLLHHRFSWWYHRFSWWHHRFSWWHHRRRSMQYTMWWFEHIHDISYLVSAGGVPEHHDYAGAGQSTALLHQNHLPHCQSACLAVQPWLFLMATCCREGSWNNERRRERLDGTWKSLVSRCALRRPFHNHRVRVTVCKFVSGTVKVAWAIH